MIIHALQGPCG